MFDASHKNRVVTEIAETVAPGWANWRIQLRTVYCRCFL